MSKHILVFIFGLLMAYGFVGLPVPVFGADEGASVYPPNGGFEDWSKLSSAPKGWDLSAVGFPSEWMPEGRPGESGYVRRKTIEPANAWRFGKNGLFLNGKILSKNLLQGLVAKSLSVSVWARGKEGRVIVRIREYAEPTGKYLDFIVEPIRQDTTNEMKQYSATIEMIPWHSASVARIEIEGRSVEIDNVEVSVLDAKQDVKISYPQVVHSVPITNKPPTIDGKFSNQEWEYALASRNGLIGLNTKTAILRPTHYYLSSDGKKLLICTVAPIPQSGLKTTVRARDGEVWLDDSIELYINPDFSQKIPGVIYHFLVNSAGAVFDRANKVSIGQQDSAWNCNGLEVASSTENGQWVLEMAIPLQSVGLTQESTWGLNLTRNLQNPTEYSDITGSGYADYASMAACRILKDAPAVQWGYDGDPKTGSLAPSARITNISSSARTYRATLKLDSSGTKEQSQTFNLAPFVSGNLTLEEVQSVNTADISLNVTDEKDNSLFAQLVRFDSEKLIGGGKQGPLTLRPRIEFYPVGKKLNVRLANADSGEYGRTDVFIYKDGNTIDHKLVEKPLIVKDTGYVTVPFAPKEMGIYVVTVVLHDKAGDCIEVITNQVEIKPTPWLGNSLGRDRIVIPPFTPMQSKGAMVSCWGRDITFNASGLPAKIISQGKNRMGGPIGLVLQTKNGLQTLSNKLPVPQFTERAKDRVVFSGKTAASGITVKLQAKMEYDGAIMYEADISTDSPRQVERLSLEIPVTNATYAHVAGYCRFPSNVWIMNQPAGNDYVDSKAAVWSPEYKYRDQELNALYFPREDGLIWSSLGLKTGHVYGNFVPHIWIGNSKYGIAWFANNDRGWANDPQHPCFEIIRKGAVTILRVNFIAKPTKLSGARKIVFGLMATPTRPSLVGANAAIKKYIEFGFGNPYIEQIQGITYRDYYLAKEHRSPRFSTGLSTLEYLCGNEFTYGDPASRYMVSEWMQEPVHAVDQYGDEATVGSINKYGLYGPRENYICYDTCAVPSRIDYDVSCFAKSMAEGAIDGVYYDNSFPNPCVNIQHSNCAYVREDGSVQAGFHLFETRDLVRRTQVLAYNNKSLSPSYAVHSTSASMAPAFGFADMSIDGEYDYGTKDFLDFFPLPYLEVVGAGSFGPTKGWLPMLKYGKPDKKSTRTILAGLKLFDIWIWLAYADADILNQFDKIDYDFGISAKGSKFIGYWDDDSHAISGLPTGVKASFFVRPGKGALIYISNLTKEKQDCSLRLDFKKWRLSNIQPVDAENAQKLISETGMVKVSVEGHDLRVIRF